MRLHDTLSRELRDVGPGPDGVLRFYTCGPTVHDFAHVGNWRTFAWNDVLRRVLRQRGFRVRHVMNLTDIDDRIIEKARAAGIDVTDPARIPAYTRTYEEAFFSDMDALRVQRADLHPRATEKVPEMIELTRRLLERGHAYEADGSVYFRIASFPAYGRLARLEAASVKPGARVETDRYEKEDVRDFVLWKAWRDGEPRWDSPWGPGRPGWHLECSVMSMGCLGAETIDLHSGGEDLVFPHHENEIAQSEGATGRLFCRTWVHGAHLRIEGEKMSKSLGNFFTLRDLMAQGHDPVALRWFLSSVHYRAPLAMSEESLQAAAKAVERLNECARLLAAAEGREDGADIAARLDEASRAMDEALDDDLNTSGALGALFSGVRDANGALASGGLTPKSLDAARRLLQRADDVFAFLPPGGVGVRTLVREVAGAPFTVTGLGDVPAAILEMVAARAAARRAREFAESDRIRDELAAAGYAVEDVQGGARVRRV